ncbi:MAG: putative manganese transporter [Kiritimatiellales bacterium]|nr:putative manganese transporter [Kiritimatiellales bacterium]
MNELFLDALIDSAKMIPFLLVIYFVVEWFERKFGDSLEHRLQKVAKAGPILGALFGCVPQCGFSVVAASLYARRLISPGTLLAVILSTSDEAIPVLLSQPEQSEAVFSLLLIKLLIGITGGYLVDLLLRRRGPAAPVVEAESHHKGCCCHHVSAKDGYRQLLVHPLVHTAKIFLFIFAVTLGLNGLMMEVGEENIGRLLLRHSLFQPLLAALVGLIPNCAASVAIAGLFLKGGLSFGSTVAGLCCSGGLGLLVLFRENHDPKDTLRIVGLLVGISTVSGPAIPLLYG